MTEDQKEWFFDFTKMSLVFGSMLVGMYACMRNDQAKYYFRAQTTAKINDFDYRLRSAREVSVYYDDKRYTFNFKDKIMTRDAEDVYVTRDAEDVYASMSIGTLGGGDKKRSYARTGIPFLQKEFKDVNPAEIEDARMAGCTIAKKAKALVPAETPSEERAKEIIKMANGFAANYCRAPAI